jgi:hypothetical protein
MGFFLILRDHLPDYLKDPVTFRPYSVWRLSKMKALEWRDVDLAGNLKRLRPELSKDKDGRLRPMGNELMEVIDRARLRRLADCLLLFYLRFVSCDIDERITRKVDGP